MKQLFYILLLVLFCIPAAAQTAKQEKSAPPAPALDKTIYADTVSIKLIIFQGQDSIGVRPARVVRRYMRLPDGQRLILKEEEVL